MRFFLFLCLLFFFWLFSLSLSTPLLKSPDVCFSLDGQKLILRLSPCLPRLDDVLFTTSLSQSFLGIRFPPYTLSSRSIPFPPRAATLFIVFGAFFTRLSGPFQNSRSSGSLLPFSCRLTVLKDSFLLERAGFSHTGPPHLSLDYFFDAPRSRGVK